MSTEAIAYWTSFAASGNPSASKKLNSPPWTAFSNGIGMDTRSRLQLTRGGDVMTASVMQGITAAEMERCQFWMSGDVARQTGV